MKLLLLLPSLLLSILLLSQVSQAQLPKYITDLYQTQQLKKEQRWTLADWMDTKRKVSLMDQWLAMNRSVSVFEFYLGGGVGKYDLSYPSDTSLNADDQESKTASIGMYISIFGAEARYELLEDRSEIQSAVGMLRILGTSDQGTNLTLHYGKRNWEDVGSESVFSNPIYGGSLTLYLFKHVGIEGSYTVIGSDEAPTGRTLEGTSYEAGLFIEALFMRVYGKAVTDDLEMSTASADVSFKRTSLEAGALFYF